MGVPVEGRNYELDAALRGGTQVSTWYMGLIEGSGVDLEEDTLLNDATDTMASHAGWTENTSYSESTRPSLTISAAAGGQAACTAASFTLSANVQLAGFFLTSNNTKGGSTGTLLRTQLFEEIKVLAAGVVYTITPSFQLETGG